MQNQRYSIGIWAVSTAAATGVGLLVGALLRQQILNPASPASHFIAPVLVGILVAAIHRQYMSKLAIILLPIGFCLAQIVAFLGIVVVAWNWGVDKGDTLITDVLVQYVPPAAGAYLLYVFYGWMVGVRSWWIGLLQMAYVLGLAFLLFNNALGMEPLLLLYFGGSVGILGLLPFQRPSNALSSTSNHPKPDTNKDIQQ